MRSKALITAALLFPALFCACGSIAPPVPIPDAATPDLATAGADAAPVDLVASPGDAASPADAASPHDAAEKNDAAPPPGPLFDLPAIRDPQTADCTFENERLGPSAIVPTTVWNVRFNSWESINGQLRPIVIRGYLARPMFGGNRRPGIVLAHGLGGFAQESSASTLAAQLDMAVLAYSGPGSGNAPDNQSEGFGPSHMNGYRMFDTLADVRGSWFWAHSVAAMRGATCLAGRADVDPARLGITGYSAGGVATHIAAGADDRFKVAVPQSGVLAWDLATQSPNAWQHPLLKQAGLSIQSPEWKTLMTFISPAARVGAMRAKLLETNGSTDEFFPLTATTATFDAVPGGDKRISIAANFDHGCYQLTGGEPKGTIEARAQRHLDGARKMWLRHHLAADPRFGHIPESPAVQVQAVQNALFAAATVDAGGGNYTVESVEFWGSNDNAFFFGGAPLDRNNATTYSKLLPVPLLPGSVYYVSVTYRTNDTLDRFALTSKPALPPNLVPRIRDQMTCQ